VRSVLGICSVVLAAAALASCGDSGPSAEDEAREAAEMAVESKDPKAFCRTLVSPHYIDLVYKGDVQECIDSDESVLDNPGQARATAVVVDPKDETRAEVEVTMRGGELDGTAGHLEMVESDDGWRLDDIDDDYLRSAFLAEIATVDEGVVAIPSMKACFKRQVKTLDAAALRDLTFTNNSGDKAGTNAKLLKLAEHCPKGLAEYGAWEITKGLEESGKRTPAFIDCIRKEVTFFLELTEITPELLKEKPGFAAVAAFEGIVVGAKKNCLETLHPDG
jgi:hypothetical protein